MSFLSCLGQLDRWLCHWVSEWVFQWHFDFRAMQSYFRHVWPLWQLIRRAGGMVWPIRRQRQRQRRRRAHIQGQKKTKTLKIVDKHKDKDVHTTYKDIESELLTWWHSWLLLTNWENRIMTLRVDGWQSKSSQLPQPTCSWNIQIHVSWGTRLVCTCSRTGDYVQAFTITYSQPWRPSRRSLQQGHWFWCMNDRLNKLWIWWNLW